MVVFSKVPNEQIYLYRVAEAVRFSFIVRNSISYLNLQLSEYSNFKNNSRSPWEVANDFVCTEEKCRKIFTPNRSILYNLNLDMPATKELSLKNEVATCYDCRFSYFPHVEKIMLRSSFDQCNMVIVVHYALQVANQKLKILRFLANYPVLKREILPFLPAFIINNFIEYFYPEITDPVLFRSFIENVDLVQWMLKYEEPSILEFLLYNARHSGRILKQDFLQELVGVLIQNRFFLNIKPLLKYIDAQIFSVTVHYKYVFKIETGEPEHERSGKDSTPERLYLILQISHLYTESTKNSSSEVASEVLRLLWSSSPDACITFREMEKAFGKVLDHKELTKMHKFYCDSVGEVHKDVEPRPLKHLCRTTIRGILKNNFWIPEGVRLTELPESLQRYLNLE